MEKALQDIFAYHETTKHAPHRYARSLGYMDWATQPDPFRSYNGAAKISLPLALDHATPPYHLLFEKEGVPSAPLVAESLSQFFQFSLGLSAWKSTGADKWALRCNASSGNLQPTEGYAVLPPLEGVSPSSTVVHYAPKEHTIELLAAFESDFWDTVPKGSFIVGLSSILWREAWKYGERSFRYCQLDTGHAWKALDISARMLGWKLQPLDIADDALIDKILGLDQEGRFFKEEAEIGEMLCLVSPLYTETGGWEMLLKELPLRYEGIVNQLSLHHHPWEILETVHHATQKRDKPFGLSLELHCTKEPSFESKRVVMQRRSAQMMDRSRAAMGKADFFKILQSIRVDDEEKARVNLLFFLHSVESLSPGMYIQLRRKSDLLELKALMRRDFLWETIDEGLGIYLLWEEDMRVSAKNFSCTQDIAGDSSFSISMLAPFSQEIIECGPKRYKELYWECGAIGQQLYLEATSLDFSATGIGCFLDDVVHRLLGLSDNRWQSLYHFTVGRGLTDKRLLTLPPYHHLG